jgi:hypothetical protein
MKTQTISLILSTLLLVVSFYTHADNLVAIVDRSTIGSGEALQLNITYTGSSSREINLDVLGAEFDVLSQSKSSSTQISFGDSNASTASSVWRILLRPKRIGNLVIPAFVIDGISSEPIRIAVKAAAPNSRNTDKSGPIFLETEISTAKPFEQEQVLLTIRMVSEYNIVDHDFDQHDPILPDAKFERVYVGKYRRQVNGRQQEVFEKIYAIYPQSPGALTIPAVPNAVIYQEPSQDPRASFFSRGNRIRKDFQSQIQTLHVQAKPPQQYLWLPAQELTLEQHWSSSPGNFVVGEPITRDITIKAMGLLASQLPELNMTELNNFKFYPDQPQLDNQPSNTGIISTRSVSTAIVASKAGRYTLPAITVKWWDLKAKRQRSATLSAVEIVVMPAAGTNVYQTPEVTAPELAASNIAAIELIPHAVDANPLWIAASGFFALTTLLFAILWRRAKKAQFIAATAIGVKPPSSDKQALQELRRHCESGLLTGVRKSLLQWAQIRWNDKTILTLADIEQRLLVVNDGELLIDLLKQLDSSLYSNKSTEIDSLAIYQQVKRMAIPTQKKQHQQAELKPLYR